MPFSSNGTENLIRRITKSHNCQTIKIVRYHYSRNLNTSYQQIQSKLRLVCCVLLSDSRLKFVCFSYSVIKGKFEYNGFIEAATGKQKSEEARSEYTKASHFENCILRTKDNIGSDEVFCISTVDLFSS